jgi:uncharacterized heparinase superfamily protein
MSLGPSLARIRQHWSTIRYLHVRQLVARVRLRAGQAWRQWRPSAAAARYRAWADRAGLVWVDDPWGLRGVGPAAAALLGDDARAHLEAQASALGRGQFTFLHESAGGEGRVDWRAPDASQLWRYHLHYFDYLSEAVPTSLPWAAVRHLIQDWVAHNPLGAAVARDAWHPYVVSLRAVNWMFAFAMAPRDAAIGPELVAELARQVVFVERNLETDVGGNHLLKNLKALAIAGCYWNGSGADALRTRFVPWFATELQRQLRSDGGHYEQSPMYHVQVLLDAAEVAMVLRSSGHTVPETLDGCLSRMAAFLEMVCHPDGQFAQFGDSAFNMTPTPAEAQAVVALARGLHARGPVAPRHIPWVFALRDRPSSDAGAVVDRPVGDPTTPPDWDPQSSGFVVLKSPDRRFHLVADLGPVCPDELPAHAHADLFGFEVSVDGVRLIVDTGVSEYRAGKWRDFERSTRAHSTVSVDGRDQSECWNSFRVGERAHVIRGRRFAGPEIEGATAAHDGYRRLHAPVTHTRQFTLIGGRACLIVDLLDGQGTHGWETFLHAHPDAAITEHADGGWLFQRGAARLRVLAFGLGDPRVTRGSLDPVQGWYAPEFGIRLPASVLTLSASGRVPATFGWLLVPDRLNGALAIEAGSDRLVRVRIGSRSYEVPFQHPGWEAA